LRAAVRSHQSRPIVERLQRALTQLKTSGRHLPQSPLAGTAIPFSNAANVYTNRKHRGFSILKV